MCGFNFGFGWPPGRSMHLLGRFGHAPGAGGDTWGVSEGGGGGLVYGCSIKSFCIAKILDAVYFAAGGVGLGRVLLCPGGLRMGGLQSCWFLGGCCSVLVAPGYILSNGGLLWVPTIFDPQIDREYATLFIFLLAR